MKNRQTHDKINNTQSTAYTHTHAHTRTLKGQRKGEGLGEMEDHLLAVQFILIQSGGRAEQRVNAAHTRTDSPRPGDAHIDTPCTLRCKYVHARTHTHAHAAETRSPLSRWDLSRPWEVTAHQRTILRWLGFFRRGFVFAVNVLKKLRQEWCIFAYKQGPRKKESAAFQQELRADWSLWPERQLQSPNQEQQETETGHVLRFVW